MEHLGSAQDEQEVQALKAAARERLAAGQGELDLGLEVPAPARPLPITSAQMGVTAESMGLVRRCCGGWRLPRLMGIALLLLGKYAERYRLDRAAADDPQC